MKTKRTPHVLIMAAIVAVFAAATWSCNKDEDPSLADLREDKLQFLEDSLRISDSLKRINSAGIVNYAISIVNGSTSSIYSNNVNPGREKKTENVVEGAVVTISQYGKTLKDTTDATGLVVFQGFFRSSVTVSVLKAGFTTVSYISAVNITSSTANNTISFVGNIIPIFETTGANTATISGRATIQTNLTNKVRENVPDGTKVTASIEADNANFASRFLTSGIDNVFALASGCGCEIMTVGEILQASYQSGVFGTVTAGNYSLTVPSAIDGLPLVLEYSDVAADQTLFQDAAAGAVIPGDRTAVYRTLFLPGVSSGLSSIPSGTDIDITFDAGTGALATAVISPTTGVIGSINVTDGGFDYVGTPLIEIVDIGGNGSGATATAVVTNRRVTGINLTSGGTGYYFPVVNIISGDNTATATAALDGTAQQVFSVNVTAQGTGYTSAPTVTFTGGAGSGAAATAQIANGRVVAVIVTASGSAYTGAPTVTFTGGGGAGATATALMGSPLSTITMTSNGSGHVYQPVVVISKPDYTNGIQAVGQAIVDGPTRSILGVQLSNVGSGYTAPPTVTIYAGGGASADAFLSGGAVIGADITNQGSSFYTAPPTVVFGNDGGGTGATGTATVTNGQVTGITITNGGSGYTSQPTITLLSGEGVSAFATVTNGAITAITVSDGGRNFTGVPRVIIDNGSGADSGGGATATATIAGGQVTGVTVTNGGTGYIEGNTPSGAGQAFSATKGATLNAKTGVSYINDLYYGTGTRQPN